MHGGTRTSSGQRSLRLSKALAAARFGVFSAKRDKVGEGTAEGVSQRYGSLVQW